MISRGDVRYRYDLWRHRGSAVRCPLCGSSFSALRALPGRPNAVCWRCGSYERHRAIGLLFEREPQLLRGPVLHVAPEAALRRALADRVDGYTTLDLHRDDVDVRADLEHTGLPDGAFATIVCSHVLEHVPDDRAAMREIRRLLRSGGHAVILVPLHLGLAATLEDDAVTTDADRLRTYGQADHVRLYGRDFAERLRASGLAAEERVMAREAGPEQARRHALLEHDVIYVCARRLSDEA